MHTGDTDTYMAFGTDTIVLTTAGTDRLTINNTSATFAGNIYIPVAKKARSFCASWMVIPSLYGQGYHLCFWPGAKSGL